MTRLRWAAQVGAVLLDELIEGGALVACRGWGGGLSAVAAADGTLTCSWSAVLDEISDLQSLILGRDVAPLRREGLRGRA
jgi:hypothetical protein